MIDYQSFITRLLICSINTELNTAAVYNCKAQYQQKDLAIGTETEYESRKLEPACEDHRRAFIERCDESKALLLN